MFKGVIKPDYINIDNDTLLEINSQTYLTLPNHKNLYSDNLYNLISNHEDNPNIDLISIICNNYCVKNFKPNNKKDINSLCYLISKKDFSPTNR